MVLYDEAAVVPPRLVRDVRVRAASLWAALHVAMAILGLWAFGTLLYAAVMSVGVALLVAALVVTDLRVSRETTLLANLGISRWRVAVWALPSVVVLETVWQVASNALVAVLGG